MARLPVPRSQLSGAEAEAPTERAADHPNAERAEADPATAGADAEADRLAAAIPSAVRQLLETLQASGHAAYVVGGSLRDVLIGRIPADWDFATSARPEQLVALVPGAVYENRFGTVTVRSGDETFEITTFRRDHDYADHRRPHRVEFGDRIEVDLARRDFTVNSIAWGGRPGEPNAVVDPADGRADLECRVLRAVGDANVRFEEDALRMIRAVRLAATLDFTIEPATRAAIEAHADLVRHLSGERIAAELAKLLAAPRPSVGLEPLRATGLLRGISPALADQRGIPQNKLPGLDLWDHTLTTVDSARAERPVVRLAALLHDIGKPATAEDGPFHGHEQAGADMARELLERLHFPRGTIERVTQLIAHHMFDYRPDWSDAAIRRFIAKVGVAALDEQLELREADNLGSGLPADAEHLGELRARIATQLEGHVALDRGDLAVDGNDLMAELGLEAGPGLGRILEGLLEAVVEDPALNDRPTLLLLAQSRAADAER